MQTDQQDPDTPHVSMIRRLWLMLLAVGPGIFCIGYTIGTGSVTTMTKSGSQSGMQLLWVLLLSCLFSWVMMEAFGRYAVVTGQTAIHSFRTRMKFGPGLAVLAIVGVVTGQWCCLSGILGLSSSALYEVARLFLPSLASENYWAVLVIATILILTMYAFLLVGRYSFFEKVLVIFVTLMGVSFLISMFIVMPSPAEIAAGLVPSIPGDSDGRLMLVAVVGTTLAAPTFVVRPLLMQGKGWNASNTKEQSRDAAIAATMMFVISASIMVCATGALLHDGKTIEKVLDMVTTLEPVAGRFAVAIFMVGALSAGLSSIFPIMMVCPLLIADFRAGQLDTNSSMFRILCGVACLLGLTVPVLGANPIAAQIATQVSNVFVLPLVIGGIIYLVNEKRTMGSHRAGVLLNVGMAGAFVFSCVISYKGLLVLLETLSWIVF